MSHAVPHWLASFPLPTKALGAVAKWGDASWAVAGGGGNGNGGGEEEEEEKEGWCCQPSWLRRRHCIFQKTAKKDQNQKLEIVMPCLMCSMWCDNCQF